MSISFKDALGTRDFFLLTLDALRWDVAESTLLRGAAPNLAALIGGAFERRQTCATFTLPAHQAFFAGFLPTPPGPGPHPRPIALRFAGSKSISPRTLTLDGECIPSALGRAGYRTICIGGTSFFNPGSPLGAALPRAFHESHWSREMGVSSPRASRTQLALAASRLRDIPREQRVFLFVNLSATHPPTRIFLKGAREESTATQAAALSELDRHIPLLVEALRARGGAVGIVCSDHGTCFGDDGHVGHRVAHEVVWTVPYAEVSVEAAPPPPPGDAPAGEVAS